MPERLLLDEKIKILPAFFSGIPEVQAVFLFGSYGTQYQTKASDIDFAVLFDKRLDIREESAILAVLSDFLGTDRVDLLNLNKAPLNLQFRSVSEGKLVFERDYITTCDYIEKLLSLYQDYAIDLNYYWKDYDAALKEAYSDGR